MIRLDPAATAVVAIHMHRGHLDPAVGTLPLPADAVARSFAVPPSSFARSGARRCASKVTEAMNQVMDQLKEPTDPFVTAAARRILERSEW